MTPERGDILHLQFDPASGREMKGDHFCLVVSPKAFNTRMKLAWVCPISDGAAEFARTGGFLVSLMGTGLRPDGSIHTHQIKALDWQARRAVLVEKAPAEIMEQVLDGLRAVLAD
ncbi:MAG: type II toxin-antitoxin system PemK/MazF family toxin [Burkholderiales bacterium]|nr:MAG: type II toxin-antitoxin system PemK/MazF family toxin [Betaproteobacteria bacterium]TAG28971.1 MAG: type II toxin-antitoxin system PemK/MazF family toxin [Burkholderiales bacterium]TAG47284.1 MAG: type II toxin-antitoxin system PemK/MazF family toxin [Betaproteobacteria bacterium]